MGYQETAAKRGFAADRDENLRIQEVGKLVGLCKLMENWADEGHWEGTEESWAKTL